MRVAVPPFTGTIQSDPCRSITRRWRSGDADTDIEVPSDTVTYVVSAVIVARDAKRARATSGTSTADGTMPAARSAESERRGRMRARVAR